MNDQRLVTWLDPETKELCAVVNGTEVRIDRVTGNPRGLTGEEFMRAMTVEPDPYTPQNTFARSKLGAVTKLVKSLEWSSDRNAAQEHPGAATHKAQCCPRCSGLDPRTPLSVMRLFPTAAGHSEDCTLRVALETLQEMMLRA